MKRLVCASWTCVLWMCALWVCACGDDAAPELDAGVEDASSDTTIDVVVEPDAGVSVALPTPPQWACPTGWVERTDGAPHCAPPGERVDCPAGQARFVDSAECAPVAACPAGTFADDLPEPNVVFVQPGADGVGTRSDPMGTIEEALSTALAGDTIALAAGTFDAFVEIPDGVSIVGRCPSETTLTFSGIDDTLPSVLVPPGRQGALSNLRVGPVEGVGVLANGELSLNNVIVESARGAGVLITALGTVTGSNVVVRNTTSRGTSGGMGVIVDGGTLNATRWVVRNNIRSGVWIEEGDATLEDLVAINNTGIEPLLQGSGVNLLAGSLTLRRADLRGASNIALEVTGGMAVAEDIYVDEVTVIDPPGGQLISTRNADLTVQRAFVRGESWTVNADDSTLVLRDAVVVNQGEGFVWAENIGVGTIGSDVTLERVVVVGGDSGVTLSGPFVFTDPFDPEPEPDPLENPTAFSISDLDVRASAGGVRFGYGLLLQEGMEGTLERASVSMARGLGIDARESRLSAQDVTVIDALPGGDLDGRPSFGRALTIDDAFVTVERANIVRALEAGIEARGGTLDLVNVTVDETLERPCAVDTCSSAPGGIGVGAYFDAVVTATNLRVYDAPLCGVQLAFGGSIDLTGGEILGATVGACVQVEGYDVRRLTNGVTYDNDTNIESTAHEIPQPPPPPSL